MKTYEVMPVLIGIVTVAICAVLILAMCGAFEPTKEQKIANAWALYLEVSK